MSRANSIVSTIAVIVIGFLFGPIILIPTVYFMVFKNLRLPTEQRAFKLEANEFFILPFLFSYAVSLSVSGLFGYANLTTIYQLFAAYSPVPSSNLKIVTSLDIIPEHHDGAALRYSMELSSLIAFGALFYYVFRRLRSFREFVNSRVDTHAKYSKFQNTLLLFVIAIPLVVSMIFFYYTVEVNGEPHTDYRAYLLQPIIYQIFALCIGIICICIERLRL